MWLYLARRKLETKNMKEIQNKISVPIDLISANWPSRGIQHFDHAGFSRQPFLSFFQSCLATLGSKEARQENRGLRSPHP
jgi:hypothetical protein